MALARMRTAAGVFKIIHDEDQDTSVTVHLIRKLINSGKFPVVVTGNRKLVNADLVIEYLARGDGFPAAQENSGAQYGKIRAVQP